MTRSRGPEPGDSTAHSTAHSTANGSADGGAKGTLASGLGWLGTSTVLARGISAVVTLALARVLDPAGFGLLALVWVVYGAALLLRDQTITGVLVYTTTRSPDREARARRGSVAVSLALAGVIALGSQLAARHEMQLVLLLFAAALVVSALGSAATARLQRDLRFRRVALSELAAVAAYAVLALALTPLVGLVGVGIAQLAGATTGVVCVLWRTAPARPSAPSPSTAPATQGTSLVGYGAATLALALLTFLFTNVDTVFVAALLGAHALGTYSLAFNLAYVATLTLGVVLNRVAFPAFARQRGKPHALRASYTRITRTVLVAVVPVALLLAVVGPVLIAPVLGERFAPAAGPLRVLAVYGAATAVAAPAIALLRAIGRPSTVVAVLAGQLAAAVALCAVLVPRAGTTGAAVAVTVPAVAGCVALLAAAYRQVAATAPRPASGQAAESAPQPAPEPVAERLRAPRTEGEAEDLTRATIAAAATVARADLGAPGLGERACLALLRTVPPGRFGNRVAEAYLVYEPDGRPRAEDGSTGAVQQAARDALGLFGPHGDLTGARVLDVGCGPGHKTLVWAEQGAAEVLGIDPDPTRIARAKALARHADLQDRVRFVTASVEQLPLPAGSVDVAILTEVMEHLPDPTAALAELRRVLAPGGRILINFKTYFSPRGSHLNDWIALPWSHLLFRERTLVRVLARMAAVNPYVGYHFPSLHRRPLPRDLVELADGGLNRITLRRYRRIVRGCGLEPLVDRLTGYGGGSRHPVKRLAHALRRAPGLDELVGGYFVTVLGRPQGAAAAPAAVPAAVPGQVTPAPAGRRAGSTPAPRPG